jgi:serine/threonine protein kinase
MGRLPEQSALARHLPTSSDAILSSFPPLQVTPAFDVLCMGSVLWEMVTDERPYLGLSDSEILEGLANPQKAASTIATGHAGIRLPRLANSPEEKLRQLVLRCLSADPACRPSMEEVQRALKQQEKDLQALITAAP